MIQRALIAYSPYLVSLLLLAVLVAPQVAGAQQEVAKYIYEVVVSFFGWFSGYTAGLLDYAINEFVVNFGSNVTGTGVGAAINTMWTVVRDLFNIFFIFGIIFIGFKLILGSDDSRTQRQLVYLIIAALLVNFSLFISKFIVDFSNILAAEVATAAFSACDLAGAGDNCSNQVSVGERFFIMMQLPTTLDPGDQFLQGQASQWGYIFGITVVFLIATFVFIAGAVMLIIRFAALCIFMVLSPFMFIGWVLPQFQGLMSKYWSGFIGRAFYAPVYIILLYFSAAIVQAAFTGLASDINGGTAQNIAREFGSNGIAATTASLGAGMGPFILSAVLLIMSIQFAGRLSADGASTAMRVGGNLARSARRTASNTGLYVPRRAAQNAVAAGGAAVTGATNLARRTPLGRGLTNNKMGQALLNARNASKQVKLGAGSTLRERQVSRQAMRSLGDREEKIRAAKGIASTSTQKEDVETRAKAERAVNDYSEKEILAMSRRQRREVAQYAKAPTIAKLLTNDELSSDEKGELVGSYKEAVHQKIFEDGKVVTEEITKLSVKQLEILGDEFVQEYSGFLSEGQMDDLKKSDSFTEQQKGRQKAVRKEMLGKFANNEAITVSGATKKATPITVTNSRQYLFRESKRAVDDEGTVTVKTVNDKGKPQNLKAGELAARPLSAFVSDGTLTEEGKSVINVDVLKQIARNANQGKPTMGDEDREELAKAIINTPGLNPRVYSHLTKDKAAEDFSVTDDLTKKAKQEIERQGNEKDIKDAVGDGTLGQ